MAKFCWEERGCSQYPAEDFDHCPHKELNGRCPVDCAFAECDRPTREMADFDLLLDPTCDRSCAIKEICCTCVFYLKNAPRVNNAQS